MSRSKDKKIYRQLANEVLQDLCEEMARNTHIDTGVMKASWETTPLKMRDSGYAIMGEVVNEARQPNRGVIYSGYEVDRGGSHDAVQLGIDSVEGRMGSTISDLLEGLLR